MYPALSAEEFNSSLEVSKSDAQRGIAQLHWERLVGLGDGSESLA